MKPALPLSLTLAALLAAPAALAQGDVAAAQGLFDAAKQLVKDGKVAEACPKFLASYKLDPKPGTLLNLADCYEKTGQIASAWARYLEAASLAQRAGQAERESYAKDHAAALEPKMARLTISAHAAPPGLQVLRDGEAIDAAILGTALPVDPGQHQIEARAPGKKPWTKTIDVAAGPVKVSVEIPPLDDAAPEPPKPPPPGPGVPPPVPAGVAAPGEHAPAAARGGFPRKQLGFAAIGVGGAGLLLGAITGGLAIKKHGDLASSCDKNGVCPGQDSAISSYHLMGTLSDVGLIVGGAIAVTGVVLVVTAPKAVAAKSAWITPVVGPGFVGATGRF